jgi:hypothetical protein
MPGVGNPITHEFGYGVTHGCTQFMPWGPPPARPAETELGISHPEKNCQSSHIIALVIRKMDTQDKILLGSL